jgi:hypothetical protein
MVKTEAIQEKYARDLFTHGLFGSSKELSELDTWFGVSPKFLEYHGIPPDLECMWDALYPKIGYEFQKPKAPLQIPLSSLESIMPLLLEKLDIYARHTSEYVPDDAHSAATKGVILHHLRNAIVVIQEVVGKGRRLEDVFPTKQEKKIKPYRELLAFMPRAKNDKLTYERAWDLIRKTDIFMPNGTIALFNGIGIKDANAVQKLWKSRDVYYLGLKVLDYILQDVGYKETGLEDTLQYCEVDTSANYPELGLQIPITYDLIRGFYRKKTDEDGEVTYSLDMAHYDDLKTGKDTFFDELGLRIFMYQCQLMNINAFYVDRLLGRDELTNIQRPFSFSVKQATLEKFTKNRHHIQFTSATNSHHHNQTVMVTNDETVLYSWNYLMWLSQACIRYNNDVRKRISKDRRRRKL